MQAQLYHNTGASDQQATLIHLLSSVGCEVELRDGFGDVKPNKNTRSMQPLSQPKDSIFKQKGWLYRLLSSKSENPYITKRILCQNFH